ncbi:hypothetical protein D918_01752 [Trichuris suis]|uniref:Uncharacterized protein n=1 Tax=Trichuris suis TaxID=68888 RepID=A0A085MNM4_9BILA|nr:hypothetical protein M513_00513 [Trichuris suis]KHJ47597.1 hypothetical protein D918_01752 [Trichuris suis]
MYPYWRWNNRNRWEKQRNVRLRSSLVALSPIYSPIIEQLSGEPLETALKYANDESDSDLPKPPEDDDTDAAELLLHLPAKAEARHVEEIDVDADLIDDIFAPSLSQSDVTVSLDDIRILYNIEEDSFGFDCMCKPGDQVFWSLLRKSLTRAPSVKHKKFCPLQLEKNEEAMDSHSEQLLSTEDTIDDAEFKDVFPETTSEITLVTCRYGSHSPHFNDGRSRRYRNCPVHIRFKSSSSDSDE